MNETDSNGETLLQKGEFLKHLKKKLIKIFTNFFSIFHLKMFCLIFKAISRGHKKAIKMLIEKGANVKVVESKQKMTPLHYIVSYEFSTPWYEDWNEDDRLSNFYFVFVFLSQHFHSDKMLNRKFLSRTIRICRTIGKSWS